MVEDCSGVRGYRRLGFQPGGAGIRAFGENRACRHERVPQFGGGESGHSVLDARRQIIGAVVKDLRQSVLWIRRALGGSPHLPDEVARLVYPTMCLPQRSSLQILVSIQQS